MRFVALFVKPKIGSVTSQLKTVEISQAVLGVGRGHRTNIWRGPTFIMSLKVTNTFLTDFSIIGTKTPPP